MSQICPLIAVFSLQVILCLAGSKCPREIEGQFLDLHDVDIVKINTALTNLANPETPQVLTEHSIINDFEADEKTLEEKKSALDKLHKEDPDYAEKEGSLKKNIEEAKQNLEKSKGEIIDAMLAAGHMVFVPDTPENHIRMPESLRTEFNNAFIKTDKKNWILLRYSFKNPRKDVDINKPVEEGHVKKIRSFDGEKVNYDSLEFTIPLNPITGMLHHTLGSIQKGNTEFLLESSKIEAYDKNVNAAADLIGNMKISELFLLYKNNDQPFEPKFDSKLHVTKETPGLRNVGGIIQDYSLKFFTEYKKDGKIHRGEFSPTEVGCADWKDHTLNALTKTLKDKLTASQLGSTSFVVKSALTFLYKKK